MVYGACVLAGVLLGVIVAWWVGWVRIRSAFTKKMEESDRRACTAEGRAASLDGMLCQLREESEKRSVRAAEDFEKLRTRLDTETQERVRAETQLRETRERLEEEKRWLEEAKVKLSDTFKALAGDSLSSNNQTFLELAKESLNKVMGEAKGDLGKREEAIQGLVRPLADSLKQFDEHVRTLETHRQEAYTKLESHLVNLTTSQQQLQKETGNLVTALRNPQVRGRWGEITLKRVVELAGMSEHCDFTEQLTASDEESGRLRPDLVVHLPANRQIVVDAKVSLDAYLRAISADSEVERENHLKNHAGQIRSHLNSLGGKAYWQQFKTTPEFVVMFIPGESFFSAAVDLDRTLIEDGMQKRVILSTPTTLIALIRAIAYGWRQEQIAKNAQEISELGKDLYKRMNKLADYIQDIGRGLEKATEAYNDAVGSLERRVFPAARRFKDLGTVSDSSEAEIAPLQTNEKRVRMLDLPGAELDEEAK